MKSIVLALCLLAPPTVALAQASPDGTTVPPASQIVDSHGTTWLLVAGSADANGNSLISINGSTASGSRGKLLLWYGGNIYDEANTTPNWPIPWYVWNGTAFATYGYTDPRQATPTPIPSVTPTPTATPTSTATASPTATATPSPIPSPTPAPVSGDCINPNITFRSETATNNSGATPTLITLPKPASAFGDRQFIYLLSSDRNPILPNQGNNLGFALGATAPWQSVDSLWEPTTIANNVWYYDPGTNEPPSISVNSPTSEGEDFIAAIDLKASCGKFHGGEYGRSVGTTGSSNSIPSPAITTSHYGEMCVAFGADDFANNQVSFANTPAGFVPISDPQIPPPVAIGYFPMTIPGAVPSFNLNSAGTSGTLVMQVVCPWAN